MVSFLKLNKKTCCYNVMVVFFCRSQTMIGYKLMEVKNKLGRRFLIVRQSNLRKKFEDKDEEGMKSTTNKGKQKSG